MKKIDWVPDMVRIVGLDAALVLRSHTKFPNNQKPPVVVHCDSVIHGTVLNFQTHRDRFIIEILSEGTTSWVVWPSVLADRNLGHAPLYAIQISK